MCDWASQFLSSTRLGQGDKSSSLIGKVSGLWAFGFFCRLDFSPKRKWATSGYLNGGTHQTVPDTLLLSGDDTHSHSVLSKFHAHLRLGVPYLNSLIPLGSI